MSVFEQGFPLPGFLQASLKIAFSRLASQGSLELDLGDLLLEQLLDVGIVVVDIIV